MRPRGYIICGFTSSLFESALTNESMGQNEPKCQRSELKGKAKTSQNLRALTGSERMGWRVQADSIITSDQTTEITNKRPDSPTHLLREWTSLTGRTQLEGGKHLASSPSRDKKSFPKTGDVGPTVLHWSVISLDAKMNPCTWATSPDNQQVKPQKHQSFLYFKLSWLEVSLKSIVHCPKLRIQCTSSGSEKPLIIPFHV